MALDTYRHKRDFTKTGEPRGRKAKARSGESFVVQKHAATRLHYDLRLELDGVLKSWAVTKGPSLVPGEKRLAVHVEDHPLEYGDFEGTIPKGEYGGGTVIVWDRGRWKPIGDPHRGYAKGHLEFVLEGEKLAGRWHLVRLRGKPREKRENWLLIKSDDEAARPADAPEIVEARPESVKTGRVIDEVAGEQPGWSSKTGRIRKGAKASAAAKPLELSPSQDLPDPAKLKGSRKAALPDFVPPVLATPVEKPPAGARWLHEIKFDGYRLQARIDAGRVKLLTRSGLDWTSKFGRELSDALRALPLGSALIDGELVVGNEGGAADFSALQADLAAGRTDRFVYYAFDLIHLDGFDLTHTPLIERKRALQQLVASADDTVRFSEHFEQEGNLVLRHACQLGLEGVISKRRASAYSSGRGTSWTKAKCSSGQEFVIAGYVPSTVARKAVGSLVLGFHDGGQLHFAGKVGTGFTAAVAEALHETLERLRTRESPFAERLPAEAARKVRYVRPELVAEIEFRGWTADGVLRHASFRGLREDKDPTDIIRESATTRKPSAPPVSVKLTHPDRIYWPEVGVTKAGLADYYVEVWPRIAPFIVGRPLSLVRCPNGIAGDCFYQKHAWQGLTSDIHPVHDPEDPSDEPILTIDDLNGLIGLVQAGVLEIHPWGSTMSNLEQPDFINFDLDPGEDVSWAEVIDAAREVRQRLEAVGVAAFVKNSGGKGLHVVSPLKPKADWEAVKAFCKSIAEGMAADSPDRFVATLAKARRRGKIFVDYLRNGRGATAIAPYSTRARATASVSMPLLWEELNEGIGPAHYTLDNAVARIANQVSDPWADFLDQAVPLPAARSRKRRAA